MQKTHSLKQPITTHVLFALTLLFFLPGLARGADTNFLNDTLEISLSSVPTGCENGTDGLVTVNITGGTIPYNVEISPQIKRRTVYNSITIPGIVPGTYNVVVTDQMGQQAFDTITVEQGAAPPVPVDLIQLDQIDGCLTECSAILELNREDGYVYRWNGRTMLSDSILRVCAGVHTLQVERLDQNCIVNVQVDFPEPSTEEAIPQCPQDTVILIPPDLCAATFDYGLQEWAAEACGVGKDHFATTDMVDDGYGLAGTMFDLRNITSDTLVITGWDLLLDEGTWDLQVYQTRISPTFVGNTFNGTNAQTNLNWRFMGQVTVTSAGPHEPTYIPLGGIVFAPNASSGIYITSTRDWLQGPISMQESTPSAVVSNCDLELSAGIGLTNRAGMGFAQGQGDLIFGNANFSGGSNNTNYRLIEANIYYVPLNKPIYQVDGTGLTSLSTFPVGPTTQALSFINNGNLDDANCTFTVSVVEPTPPTFLTCPQNIEVAAGGTNCSAEVIYDTPTYTDNCLVRDLDLTLNRTDSITGRARCFNQQTGESPQSAHLRVFDLRNHNLVSPFLMTEVSVGVSESNGSEEAIVNIYEIDPDSTLEYANLNLLATQSFTPPAGTNFVHPVALNATVSPNRKLVVELVDPENTAFVAGYTEEGSDVSYFAGCGFDEPTSLREINCVKRHFYARVKGSSDLVLTMAQTDSTGFTSGDEFPDGITLQEFTATDASGNTEICSFTVTVIGSLDVALSSTPTTCLLNEGSIEATVQGGSGPYTFLWSNGSEEESLSNLAPGDYSATVSDATGCTVIVETTVEGDQAPVVSSLIAIPSLCGNDNGAVETKVSGVNGPFGFEWNTGSTEPAIDSLSPGVYFVTVTDTLGCASSASIEVTEIPGPSIVSLTSESSICGNDNGSAEIVADGDNGPFSFLWSNGATDSLAADLAPGFYTVSVTDANGCVTEQTIEVDEITGPDLSFFSTSPSLCGGNDGAAEVIPAGNAPYTYEWETGTTDSVIVDLSAGLYEVSVTDSNGCVTVQSVEVNDLPGPDLSLTTTLPSGCIVADGTASVEAIGTGPFSYEWETGATDSTATGLLPGVYQVSVTDNNNCLSVGETTVETPLGPALSIVVTPPSTCLEGDASAEVFANGIGPFTYAWSTGEEEALITGLVNGTYAVEVVDSVGCVSFAEATVEPVSDLAIAGETVAAALCGEENGAISVAVEGGTWPYVFAWDNGAQDSVLTDLPPGEYLLSVTDSLGCEIVASFTVEDVASPVIDNFKTVSAYCGQANGTAEVFFSGGNGDYSVLWSNGAEVAAISGLTPGDYGVSITDGNGCEVSASVVVEDEPGQSVEILTIDQPTECISEDGLLAVEFEGGTGPYSVLWSTGSEELILANLPVGVYSVVVTDSLGCEVSAMAELLALTSISIDMSGTSATCGNDNGTALANLSGGGATLQYLWTLNGDTLETGEVSDPFLFFSDLGGGFYELQLSDSTGCAETATIEVIEETTPLIIPAFIPTTCGQSNGVAWVEIQGGAWPFTFVWENGSADSLLVDLPAGEYALAVLDDNNCITTGIVVVEDLPAPFAAVEVNPATCELDNGQISLGIISSTPEYIVLWSTGDSTDVISDLPGGFYSVYMVDENGCETTIDSIEVVVQADDLEPVFTVCPIDIEVNTCIASIEYELPEAEDNCGIALLELVEGLESGEEFPAGETVVSYRAEDVFGNEAFCTFTVNRIEDLEAEASFESVSCSGSTDGTATLIISGGTAPYVYLWSTTDTTEIITGLAAGTYFATVADQNGCIAQTSIEVLEPAMISIALDSLAMETPPCNNGAIYITPNGGTAPYTFNWVDLDNPEFTADTEDLEGIEGGTYECEITDANGCSIFSATYIVQRDPDCFVSTKETDPLSAAIELFPNPTNGMLMIQIQTPVGEDWQFSLFDLRGVELQRFSGQWLAERQFQLDLSAYANGAYWLRVNSGTGYATKQIILSR